jgi:hypothetical protein
LQAAGAVVGDLVGALADPVVSRLAAKPATSAAPDYPQAAASFDRALEPIARRMERVKMPVEFVRDALVPGATLELNELAMRWAGMPNKNERAAMREVLDLLAQTGYVEPTGDETWKVLRAAD